jgi:hypothetical protein
MANRFNLAMATVVASNFSGSAASRMPAELWLAVLELLDEDGTDIHIFDQSYERRLARTRNFRALSLVCRSLAVRSWLPVHLEQFSNLC